MKVGNIDDIDLAKIESKELRKAMEWLMANWRTIHETGEKRVTIDGKKVFANIDNPEMVKKEDQILEVHRKYTDIHVPVDKVEIIGVRSVVGLSEVVAEYDADLDRAFYSDAPTEYFKLNPGEYAIMTPYDAHAPIIGEGTMKKICVKVQM